MGHQTPDNDESRAHEQRGGSDGQADRGLLSSRRTLLKTVPAAGLLSRAVDPVAAAVDKPTVDNTDQQTAEFSGSDGAYTITASGSDITGGRDEYAAIYEDGTLDRRGSVVATVESQENTDNTVKAGVYVANDITAAGSSAGDVAVGVTPEAGIKMWWDADGDGYFDSAETGRSTTYPCTLKIERSGSTFTGYYSTDGGETYTAIMSVDLEEANETQDAGIFNVGRNTLTTVDYSGFRVVDLPTVDATGAGDATFSGSDGSYTIEAAGTDITGDRDEYAAIYEDDVLDRRGSVVATVDSQENTDGWVKAGVYVANDITAAGSSAGDVAVYVTPENGIKMLWDADGDGYFDSGENGRSTTYPCTLKIERSGTTFTGSYSTDGGETYTMITSVDLEEANETQDAGIFNVGRTHPTTVDYSGLRVVDLPTVDATSAGDAIFIGSDGSYTIEAAGTDIVGDRDEYAAVYQPDAVHSEGVAVATVESQENTDDTVKAGVYVANDITGPGSSAGDIAIGVTPEAGIKMWWDGDGDGYFESSANGRSTTYPCRLKIERSGTSFTGSYSTDDGETYTAINTVDLEEAAPTQDAGLFNVGRTHPTTVEYSRFDAGPTQLPDGSEAIDRLVFGEEPSETRHDFVAETSRVAETHSKMRDTLQVREIDVPSDPSNSVGSMAFTMECDPEQRTHLTLKLDANPPIQENVGSLFLFHGDELVGYVSEDDDWPTLGGGGRLFGDINFSERQVFLQKSEWIFTTMQLPESLTNGTTSIDLRIVYADWYHDNKVPSNPLFRAYTHTDPLFELPTDEVDTLGRDLGTAAGPDANPTAALVDRAETVVENNQDKDRVDAKGADALARAYSRDWISTVDHSAIFQTVTDSIDHYVVEQAESTADDPPADITTGNEGWWLHGRLARAFEVLSDVFENSGVLSDPIPDHPEDISRGEAYADFWVEAYDWRSQSGREFITNQVMAVTVNLIAQGEALQVLDRIRSTDRAPPDSELDQVADEGFGVEPMTNMFGSGGYQTEIWHPLSKNGLNREWRYAAGHGRAGLLEPHRVAKSTTDAERAKRIKERLSTHIEAMGEFRWRGQNANPDSDRRFVAQESYLGSRGGTHVGRTGRFRSHAAVAKLLGSDDEVAKRWAELELEHGNQDYSVSNQPLRILPRIIWQKEGIDAVQNMSASSHDLPWERQMSVWGDHTQGMVSIVDGDVRLMVSLGHNEGTHISNTALFDYAGQRSDRVGMTELRRKEFPLYETRQRPNYLHNIADNHGISPTRYLTWKDTEQQVDQYLRGDSIPLASKPDGTLWPDSDQSIGNTDAYVGFCYHYREVQIGQYLIGVNSTGAQDYGFAPAQSFKMDVPTDSATNLATGTEVTANTVTVDAEETKVLRLHE